MEKPWSTIMENVAETPEELGKLGNLVYKTVKPSQKPEFKIGDFKAVYWNDGCYGWHPCAACGQTKLTSWQAETFQLTAVVNHTTAVTFSLMDLVTSAEHKSSVYLFTKSAKNQG